MMNSLLFFVALACIILQLSAVDAIKSAGCGKTVASTLKRGGTGKSNSLNFTTSKNQKRTYLLHIPTNYDVNTATDLIFSFHGRSNTGSMQESLTKFSNEVWNPDSFVVYPDGLKNEWQGDPDAAGFDDVSFVLELLSKLENDYCIDTSRVYATGMSNGGGFSLNILACDQKASQKFAAFASNSGAYYQKITDVGCNAGTIPISCNPGRTGIPILEIHGSADGTIPYHGGGRRGRCLPTVPRFVTAWAQRNGLSSTNTSTSLYNGNVKKQEFGTSSGQQGLVTHYWVKDLGHTWASTSDGSWFNATPTMLAFFRKYTLLSVSVPISSQSSSAAQAVTTSTTSMTYATSSTVTSLSCPFANNTIFTDSNAQKYRILCAFDTSNQPLKSAAYPGSFAKCIELCDITTGCKSVAYNGACYLKGVPAKYVHKTSDVSRVAVNLT